MSSESKLLQKAFERYSPTDGHKGDDVRDREERESLINARFKSLLNMLDGLK